MNAAVVVPLLRTKFITSRGGALDKGEAPTEVPVRPLHAVLTTGYQTDAHFACYVPSQPYRLKNSDYDVGAWVGAIVLDVDGADHKASDEWWQEERVKVLDLLEEHPDAFVYRTKGGYRIVYLTSRPWHIVDATDDWAFACYYAAVCRYLERRFSIHADTSCGQWTRLFRAPHATRDHCVGPERRETIGDARNIGVWSCELTVEDMTEAEKETAPVEVPKMKVQRNPGSAGADFADAAERFNRDNRGDHKKAHGTCPDCKYKGGFGVDDDGKWFCFNDDAHAFGKRHRDGWHGDMLDIAAGERGMTRQQVLLADGYLKPLEDTHDDRSFESARGPVPPIADGAVAKHDHRQNDDDSSPLLIDARDFFAGDEAEDDIDEPMLIEKMLPIAAPVFLAGLPEARKTTLALLKALCVAAGIPFLGKFAVTQGTVALFLEEDSERRMRARLRRLARGLGLDVRELPLKIAVQKGIALDDATCVDRIIRESKDAAMNIIDSLSRAHGADENDRTAMRVVTRALTRISVETGATVAVIHHMRKKPTIGGDNERPGQRMRGTGDLHALARATVSYEKLANGIIKIGCEGNYTADLEPLFVSVFEGDRDGHKVITVKESSFRTEGSSENYEAVRANAKCEAVDTAVLELLAAGPRSSRQVRALLKGRFGHTAIDDALARLELAGTVERGGPCEPRSTTPPWRLKVTPEQLRLGAT